MDEVESLRDAVSRILEHVEDASPLDAVEAVTHELARRLGAMRAVFLIMDLSGRALVRLAGPAVDQEPGSGERSGPGRDGQQRQAGGHAQTVSIRGRGPHARALATQTVQVLRPGTADGDQAARDGWTVLAPVTERGEVLGLLELTLPVEPSPNTVAELSRTAHLLAFVVIANRRHTDSFESGQRSTSFTLPAEIQRRLLPAAFTCESGSFTLSGWLEPAADAAGDTFDYSLGRDVLHLSVTDAMGHGVESALTATLCVGSLRNTRRDGRSLVEQATAANTALADRSERTGNEGFVTGLLGRLDLRTGVLTLINAGHVSPYLLREDDVLRVDLVPDLPMGMFLDVDYTTTDLALRPGDRLVIVTDGVLERGAAVVDLLAEIRASGSWHPREAVRALADSVLDATGSLLDDDATLLVLDWHAHHGRERTTQAGANRTDPRG